MIFVRGRELRVDFVTMLRTLAPVAALAAAGAAAAATPPPAASRPLRPKAPATLSRRRPRSPPRWITSKATEYSSAPTVTPRSSRYRIDARHVPLLTTGKTLGIIDLPKADRASGIVVGPGDVELPMHAAPYKEMFIVLGGSFVFKTAKVAIPMGPGSVLLFDDVGAKVGHGGGSARAAISRCRSSRRSRGSLCERLYAARVNPASVRSSSL